MLENRLVVVTGGAGALGVAVVRAVLAAGGRVAVPVFEDDPDAGGLAGDDRVRVATGIDLADDEQVTDFFAEHAPTLWGCVNVAGGFDMTPLIETTREQLDRMWRMNARTCYMASREAAKAMVRAGEGGRIVNVAAVPGLEPEKGAGMSAYTVAKAAVVALTKASAAELAEHDIRVNAIAPTVMDTPANRSAMPDADPADWVSTEEAAAAILGFIDPACDDSGQIRVLGR